MRHLRRSSGLRSICINAILISRSDVGVGISGRSRYGIPGLHSGSFGHPSSRSEKVSRGHQTPEEQAEYDDGSGDSQEQDQANAKEILVA